MAENGKKTATQGTAEVAEHVTGKSNIEILQKGKYAAEVLKYVQGCIDGTIIAGEDRILACERFLKFLERDDFEIRTHAADFVVGIIENTYCHRQGEALVNKCSLFDVGIKIAYAISPYNPNSNHSSHCHCLPYQN